MKRIGLAVLLLLLAAASPPHGPLPLPPIPPPPLPTDGRAPTPDRGASAPVAALSEDPRLSVQFVQVPTYQDNFDQAKATPTVHVDRRIRRIVG
jgi:hypothetical protein